MASCMLCHYDDMLVIMWGSVESYAEVKKNDCLVWQCFNF